MRIAVKETKVFKFNELSEEAQENALEKLYDLNVDYEWYEGELDYYKDEWEKNYGITFDKAYFDLDRAHYLYFDKAHIVDGEKLVKIAKCRKLTRAYHQGDVELYFDNVHFGGGVGRTNLEINYPENIVCNFDFNEWFKDITEELLRQLGKQYDYLTSREAIVETIEANDYEFTEDGDLY